MIINGALHYKLLFELIIYGVIYVFAPLLIAGLIGSIAYSMKSVIAANIFVSLFGVLFETNLIVIFIEKVLTGKADAVTSLIRKCEIFNTSLFNIATEPNLYAPLSISRISVLNQLFWLSLFFSIYLWRKDIFRYRRVYMAISIVFSVMCCVFSLDNVNEEYVLLLNNPHVAGGNILSEKISDSWQGLLNYYRRQENKEHTDYLFHSSDQVTLVDTEKISGFTVSEMDLYITSGAKTKISAQLKIDGQKLEQYEFTLMHNWIIDSVQNAVGEPLEYERDGDYLTIKGIAPDEDVFINYYGTDYNYYSSKDMTYLPEYCRYYPIAGKNPIFNVETGEVIHSTVTNDLKIHIVVDAPYRLVSNLERKQENEFEGMATGVTLLGSDYMDCVQIGEVNIAYSVLQYRKEDVIKRVSKLCEGENLSRIPNRVFLYGGNSMVQVDSGYMNTSDYVLGNLEKIEYHLAQ